MTTNWRCPNCGFDINFARETRCSFCDEPNPSNPPPGPMPVFFWATMAFVVAALVVGAAWALL